MSISAVTDAVNYFNRNDINRDGSIDSRDSVSAEAITTYDLNQDGRINLVEYTLTDCQGLIDCSINFILATNLSALISSNTSTEQKNTAIEILASIGVTAIEPLIALLTNPEESIRSLAVNALVKIGPSVIEPLVVFMNNCRWEDDDPAYLYYNAAVYVISNLGESATDPLIELLHNSDPAIRGLAGDYLFGENTEKALTAFIDVLMTDNDQSVRSTMIDNIWGVTEYSDNESIIDRAMTTLIEGLGDPDPEIRAYAAFKLGLAEDERAIGPLAELLSDTDACARKAARKAIERIVGATNFSEYYSPCPLY
ncbi:HEAT repeat domain-containing protein [Candidatus Saganbacteria bacterium]|nr:HEAT repeat domain-containing protein [Candidatus Saganbacteria bacterium]